MVTCPASWFMHIHRTNRYTHQTLLLVFFCFVFLNVTFLHSTYNFVALALCSVTALPFAWFLLWAASSSPMLAYPQGVQFLYTGIFLNYLKEEQHKEKWDCICGKIIHLSFMWRTFKVLYSLSLTIFGSAHCQLLNLFLLLLLLLFPPPPLIFIKVDW